MNFQEFLHEFEKRYSLFLAQKIKQYKKRTQNKELQSYFDHIGSYAKGGKRIRPFCVYIGFLQSGKQMTEKEWSLCIAVELIHLLALIHDDIIDDSISRREGYTVNGYIEEVGQISPKNKKKYAYAQSLLIGDLIFHLAFESLYKADVSQSVQDKVHELLDEVIVGQMLDVYLSHSKEVSKQEILKKTTYKTALYTFSRPFEIGALYGGVSSEIQKNLSEIGKNIGIGFQIQDDYLDIFGTEEIIKKKLWGDIAESQQTLITHYFSIQANAKDKKTFESYLGKKVSKKQGVQIQNLLQKYEVDTITLRDMNLYFKKATQALKKSSLTPTVVENIQEMIHKIQLRTHM